MECWYTSLLSVHVVVGLLNANGKVRSLEKSVNALGKENREQKVGKYRTI